MVYSLVMLKNHHGRLTEASRRALSLSKQKIQTVDPIKHLEETIVKQTDRIIEAISKIQITNNINNVNNQNTLRHPTNNPTSNIVIDEKVFVTEMKISDIEKGFEKIEESIKVEDSSLSQAASKLKALKRNT
jgi:hypothetical protein